MRAITSSLHKMPYGLRYMARETLNAVKVMPNSVLCTLTLVDPFGIG